MVRCRNPPGGPDHVASILHGGSQPNSNQLNANAQYAQDLKEQIVEQRARKQQQDDDRMQRDPSRSRSRERRELNVSTGVPTRVSPTHSSPGEHFQLLQSRQEPQQSTFQMPPAAQSYHTYPTFPEHQNHAPPQYGYGSQPVGMQHRPMMPEIGSYYPQLAYSAAAAIGPGGYGHYGHSPQPYIGGQNNGGELRSCLVLSLPDVVIRTFSWKTIFLFLSW